MSFPDDTAEQDKPPSLRLKPSKPWLVALLANVKEHDWVQPPDLPPDFGADYDYIETIDTIRAAIESGGHKTVFLQADRHLPYALQEVKPDICFNIAEGLGGDAREAQTPALLELLGIPYTGSRVLANAIALDKPLTKRIWRERGLPVGPFQEFFTPGDRLSPELEFPLFVKPAREGTGMGVDSKAKVSSEAELRERVEYILKFYKQPALVETFLPGREFTVGQLGRPGAARYSFHPEWYAEDGFHRLPILELDSRRATTPGIYSHAAKSAMVGTDGAPLYLCPADIEPDFADYLHQVAIQAHQAIGALDVSRVDFRLDARGQACMLEINPLPGLTPGYSDLCIQAAAEGIAYEDLILEILYLGASRWGLVELT
jgi:D-alanine-D-alanine ligase